MSIEPKKPIQVFFSYSHKDEEIRDQLEKHLSILKRQSVISGWHDRKILAGNEWSDQIDQQIKTSDIILLLISSDFLDSDYCYGQELKIAMERHNTGEARVIPIIIRSVDWNDSPFSKLQALPKDAKPVKSWSDIDEAFTSIAQGIRTAIGEIKTKKSPKEIPVDSILPLLKKFKLRPKKYSQTEIIADISLKDYMEAISEPASSCFRLSLGDAICRNFTFTNPDINSTQKLYAEGKNADWLEEALSTATYRVRLRFLFGIKVYESFNSIGEPYEELSTFTGYKLMEVIPMEENSKSRKPE